MSLARLLYAAVGLHLFSPTCNSYAKFRFDIKFALASPVLLRLYYTIFDRG